MMLHPLPLSRALVCACSLYLSIAACAQQNNEQTDDKPESEVVLPAAPQKAQLLPFYVSPTSTLDFAVDANSVSVSSDGIVRFTLVIASATGARNVSYEGIRCSSNERKLYATGRADGTWVPARRDMWQPITDVGANRQHAALARDYFCDSVTIAGKAENIVDRLRKKKTLR